MLTLPRWHTLRTAADWQAVATAFLNEAIEAAKSGDTNAMSDVCDAMGLFIQKRTTKCPPETVDAVYGAHSELTKLAAGEIVGSIASRTVQLRAYLNDIETITARVARQASLISLEPVRQIVTEAEGVISDLKTLKAAINNGEPAANLKSRIDALISSLNAAVKTIKKEIPGDANG